MADVIIPGAVTATPDQTEIRCHAAIATNDLDIPMSGDLTAKFGLLLCRTAEEQDATGKQVNPRKIIDSVSVPMATAMTRNFTAAGITATGAQVLALFNEVVDTYKGTNLP